MISDFYAGLKLFVGCPVGKKVQAVIYAGTNQRGSENQSYYMHLMENRKCCKNCYSERNQN